MSADDLIPDPEVRREFNISEMTMWRWDRNPELIELGWPPPVYITRRKYRNRAQLDKFKAALLQRAIAHRGAV